MIDSHAHLADPRFDDDRDEVLTRAREAGVEAVVVIGSDAESSRRVVEIVEARADDGAEGPELSATAGIAPHHVEEVGADDLEAVRGLLERPSIVAVGEIGLEYHYDLPREDQRELFVTQIAWALDLELPIVVHSREAEDDMVGILEEHVPRGLKGVIHCFTESGEMARRVVELGFHCSFSGILTFGNAGELRRTAAAVPLERTLIETDSPWLAPEPHRGRRNEPARVGAVAETLAGLHDRSAEEVGEITAANARGLFGLPGS